MVIETKRTVKEKKPFRRKVVITAIVPLLVIISALIFIYFTQQEPKLKPNPASGAIIRQLAAKQLFAETGIKKDPNELSDEDFAQITEFELHGKELCDFRLLEKFTNLRKLGISDLRYSMPKWMKILAKLGIHDFEKRFAFDLSPLEKLTNLQDFRLRRIPIKNIKPLASLVNLEYLQLNSTSVSDIEPIKELRSLENLNLIYTSVSDIEPLRELKKLKVLNLDETKVNDLRPLQGLINLEGLTLSDTPVSYLDSLKELQNLQSLILDGTPVSSLEPLIGLTKLHTLYLIDCNNLTEEQINNLQKALPKLIIIRNPAERLAF